MKNWNTGLMRGITVSVVALGWIAAVAYVFFWDPKQSWEPAPNEAATRITSDELSRAAELRAFFGHMSVGRNILSGVQDVFGSTGVEVPEIVEIVPGETPTLEDGPVLVHALIGENYHPLGKLENFDATLRAGLADEIDVAVLKFCYLDVSWYTDVESLFASYQETMDALERDYPEVRFLHSTVPLTTGPYGIKDHLKVLLGRDNNPGRERFNDMMRAAYEPDQLLDVAAIESRFPDGSTKPELYPGYTDDGSHLNDAGSALVAVEMMLLLAGSGG